MKVCMLAYNSVMRDTRILKEANTLANYGHEVTVIGFKDQNYNEDTVHMVIPPQNKSLQ